MNPTDSTKSTDPERKPQADDPANPPMQGEGNVVAGRRYDEAQRQFVESGRVDEAAREAKPQNTREAEEMDAAEEEGRSHAKGEDPALRRARP